MQINFFIVFVIIQIAFGQLHFGARDMNMGWRDGDGGFRIGAPLQGEMWRDGNGMNQMGPPKANQMWTEGSTKQASSDSIFSSSLSNKITAAQAYPNSPVEQFVARTFGDELHTMRDDLIQRKSNGEGFVDRHLHAWSEGDNWKWDKNEQSNKKANECGGGH